MSGNICKNLASYSRVGVCSSARSELLKTSVEFEALGASVKWKHFPTVCLNLFKHSKPRVKVSNNVFYSEEVESKSMETINKTLFFHTARPKRLLLILVQSESTVQKQVLSQRERLLLLYFCPAKLFNSQTVRMKTVACVCVCVRVFTWGTWVGGHSNTVWSVSLQHRNFVFLITATVLGRLSFGRTEEHWRDWRRRQRNSRKAWRNSGNDVGVHANSHVHDGQGGGVGKLHVNVNVN